MGVFLGDQELTSTTFMCTNDDEACFESVAKLQHQDVARLDFMWCDQKVKALRSTVEHLFDEQTKVLSILQGNVSKSAVTTFTKYDFKAFTLGLSIPYGYHVASNFRHLQVLRLTSSLVTTLDNLACLPSLRVLFCGVTSWKEKYVDTLAKLKCLTTLSCYGLNERVQHFVDNLSKLKNLKHLELEGFCHNYHSKATFGQLGLLDKLVDLRLRANLFDTSLCLPFGSLRSLETLHFVGFGALPCALPGNLKYLHVGQGNIFDVQGLKPNPLTFKDLYLRVV